MAGVHHEFGQMLISLIVSENGCFLASADFLEHFEEVIVGNYFADIVGRLGIFVEAIAAFEGENKAFIVFANVCFQL